MSKTATPKGSRRKSKLAEVAEEDEDMEIVEAKPSLDVNFHSDDDLDPIQDIARLNTYKPALQDIPEEDIEAQALLGKYGRTSSLIGARNLGFQTPKKANSMYERTAQILQNSASKCASPIPARLRGTPSRKSIQSRTTTPTKGDGDASSMVTPSRGRSSRASSTTTTPLKNGTPMSGLQTPLKALRLSGDDPQTPAASRRAIKNNLAKIRSNTIHEQDDDEESSDDKEDDSDDDQSEEEEMDSLNGFQKLKLQTPEKVSDTKTKPIGRAPRKRLVKETSENYFTAHDASGKIMTSDKTLDQLSTPRLSQEALQHLLSGVKLQYQSEIDCLLKDYHGHFFKWRLLLEENFSLLLYGLGSKRRLIQDFQSCLLEDENVVVVNGFFPSLALKQILNAITVDILETDSTFGSPSEQVEFICKNLKESLFLIVHNLDGSMLRGDKNQSMIARLSAHPKIHLIASTDHINAPLMWDQTKLSQFNFVFYDVTTFLPYNSETLNENSMMVKQTSTLALNSLTRVFASLTPNAKGIYLIIVKYQMDAVKESGADMYSGISFKDLYRMCRKAFLVNADLTLRAQLTEFRDHKLIRSRKGVDGLEYLIIPLDNPTLQQFLEQQESS